MRAFQRPSPVRGGERPHWRWSTAHDRTFTGTLVRKVAKARGKAAVKRAKRERMQRLNGRTPRRISNTERFAAR